MTSPFSFLFGKKTKVSNRSTVKSNRISRRARRGISPVIATTIILAITIVLGLALWTFANSGVSNATIQYSQAVEEYGEVVRNHRFVIANVHFDYSEDKVTFWLYNSGKMDTTIRGDYLLLLCKLDCKDTDGNPIPSGPILLTASSLEDQSGPCAIDPQLSVPVCDLPQKGLKKFVISADSIVQDATYELTVISGTGLTQTALGEAI